MIKIKNLVTICRRQLHTTVVSREIIRPSSPTPSHLKTHNLSLFDQIVTTTFTPLVAFYPTTYDHKTTLHLKNSLSQTLTKYYPFAGRLAKSAPTYVDCNDDGAEFHEASVDTTLSDFLENSQHEDLDQLFPNGLVWYKSNHVDKQCDRVTPLFVQINRFECGGLAVAVSLSHKVADLSSVIWFLNDWAKVTRSSSKEAVSSIINPHFISFPHKDLNFAGFSIQGSNDCVTKSFTFRNKKINDLKRKVVAMTVESEQPITNLTRVEVLTWLLYKCAVTTSSSSSQKHGSGTFQPTAINLPTNIRRKMIEPLADSSIGNILTTMEVRTKTESEMRPEYFIGELKKKKKTELEGLKDLESVFSDVWSKFSKGGIEGKQRRLDVSYVCSSMCRSDAYGIDFGWGKPIKTSMGGNVGMNSFVLMDTPDGDGIEALVCLRKNDMGAFERDSELQSFL